MWTAGSWQSLGAGQSPPLLAAGQPVCARDPCVSPRPHLLLPPAPQPRRKTADGPGGGAGMTYPVAPAATGPGSHPGWEDRRIGPQPPPRRCAHLPRWVRATGHAPHPSPERLPHHLGQQTSSPHSACGTPPQPSLVLAGPLCHLPGPRKGRRDRLARGAASAYFGAGQEFGVGDKD